MKRIILSVIMVLFMGATIIAQKTITGTVTDKEGEPLIGANVYLAADPSVGTITDFDGEFEVEIPEDAEMLEVSFTGFQTKQIELGESNTYDITLSEGVQLSEAVVTALGISRDKKSLGYATQEVDGEDISAVQSSNVVNTLSGRVSGVNINQTNNMGGSTNILIRGNTSLTGNNQPLFVINGIPISNRITNTSAQSQGGTGYDFGNAASDINPANIKSINILKGASATALYGSRAANGVVMIETKKGTGQEGEIGVELNTAYTFGTIDRTTFPTYQKEYGSGYSGGFLEYDANGDGTDDEVVKLDADASYGTRFDENRMVYYWDAFVPESDNYRKARPWVAAENGPASFFENSNTYNNSIAIDKAYDKGSFRATYSNYFHTGILPNSKMEKNNFTLNSIFNATEKLKIEGYGSFITTDTKGRSRTGYTQNLMSNFRQWWQINTDLERQRKIYEKTGKNYTWNPAQPGTPLTPIFWNNPYFQRYENFETDGRNRFIGNLTATYSITDWLDVVGRVTADTYNELQEQRMAQNTTATSFGVGTAGVDGSLGRLEVTSGYSRKDIVSTEYNYDLMLQFDKRFNEQWSLNGVLGSNIRRNRYSYIFASTNGGINIPGLFSLSNSSQSLLFPVEQDIRRGVNGLYANASVGYDGFIYIEGSVRRDVSSTLPEDNNTYYYPSISGSFIFSELMDARWLSFGKLRLNYAEVGSDAPFASLLDVYAIQPPVRTASTSVGNRKNNSELVPERSISKEIGLQMDFLRSRLGFDLAFYRTNTKNQILPVSVSTTTGYSSKVLNAGEIQNQGVELSLYGTPVQGQDFQWNLNLNWSKNVNEVVSLTEGLDNLPLGGFQSGLTINARPGQPYGVLNGTDFVYNDNGEKLVSPVTGLPLVSETSDKVIGNPTPDWVGGLMNSFSYKNLSLSFLIDVQMGGDIFSLDHWYGLATGLYDETAGTNVLGNPKRDPLRDKNGEIIESYAANASEVGPESGGYKVEGVTEEGNRVVRYVQASGFGGFGYASGRPQAAFVYDASFVKLRNVRLTYSMPQRWFDNTFLKGINVSLAGNNLWIIHKNFPDADPESGLGAGNLQGFSSGPLPTTKEYSFNLNLKL